MSIWVSVYCRKRQGAIDPTRLIDEIKARIAIFSGLYAQEDAEETLRRLRAERYPGSAGGVLLHLHYLLENLPIVVDQVSEDGQVAGYVNEYLEEFLEDRKGVKVAQLREHLVEVKEIFSFCLKQKHADGMGTPITYAAAAWLAEVGDGLIRVDEQGWIELRDKGDFAVILPE